MYMLNQIIAKTAAIALITLFASTSFAQDGLDPDQPQGFVQDGLDPDQPQGFFQDGLDPDQPQNVACLVGNSASPQMLSYQQCLSEGVLVSDRF